jgi:four helix bundle protein
MALIALDVSLDLIRRLRSPVSALARRDPSLADQLRRAASSVSLNLAEGSRREGKDRLQHWRIAAGSADEVVAGLRVAEAWGHLEPAEVQPLLALGDRLLGMLWGLTH